jgi:hypothetical protein
VVVLDGVGMRQKGRGYSPLCAKDHRIARSGRLVGGGASKRRQLGGIGSPKTYILSFLAAHVHEERR